MDFYLIALLNGLSYGLLLFMLSAGLTLIFSMMGVLNFAHASFYMLGAYLGYTLTPIIGFWLALLTAPVAVGLLGALFERWCLRKVHPFGHVPELLATFGLSYIIHELVQLVWGRNAVPFQPPEALQKSAFTLIRHADQRIAWAWGHAPADVCTTAQTLCTQFPATRAFIMLVAIMMLISVWLLLTRTRIGLVIQAALTHPETTQTLGHNVPRVFMLVFGAGTGLAGLAGVIGGSTFVTEPAMAMALGPLIFVVIIVGGLGSLSGAFFGSLMIGLVQTFAVALDHSLIGLIQGMGIATPEKLQNNGIMRLSISQVAPILPYLLLILVLIFRPKGLLGRREG